MTMYVLTVATNAHFSTISDASVKCIIKCLCSNSIQHLKV